MINCTSVFQLFGKYDQQITDASEGLEKKGKTTQVKLFATESNLYYFALNTNLSSWAYKHN